MTATSPRRRRPRSDIPEFLLVQQGWQELPPHQGAVRGHKWMIGRKFDRWLYHIYDSHDAIVKTSVIGVELPSDKLDEVRAQIHEIIDSYYPYYGLCNGYGWEIERTSTEWLVTISSYRRPTRRFPLDTDHDLLVLSGAQQKDALDLIDAKIRSVWWWDFWCAGDYPLCMLPAILIATLLFMGTIMVVGPLLR